MLNSRYKSLGLFFVILIPIFHYLMLLSSVLCAEQVVKFDKTSAFSIEVTKTLKVNGSLFLWYDGWNYAVPEDVEMIEPNLWHGTMPKAGAASGYVSYTQRVSPTSDGGAEISLEFHRNGDIQLTRGIFLLLEFPATEGMSERIIAFTHNPPCRLSDDYGTAARGFSINLSDSKSLKFGVDRACLFERRSETAMNIRLSTGAESKINLHLQIRPAFDESAMLWQIEPQESRLAIRDVKLSSDRIPRFHMLDVTIDLSATYDNPFDPDDIEVNAVFTAPSGRKIELPGFVFQDYKAEYEEGLELLSREGNPLWKVRFTPVEIGPYSLIINVRDRSGRLRSKEWKFDCVESDSKGFLKISKPPVDGSPIYFQFDNGDTLFLIGHNVTTYSAKLEEYFSKMKAGGENYSRFWMWSQALGLEWGQEVGFYRAEEAWKMDKVIELARKYGIYLMICFDTHQDFRENWKRNPYNEEQGGPCREPLDFFEDENARDLYKKRLRYIVARWSAYTNILAWEFMNEIEGWEGAERNRNAVTKWHAEMGRELRKLDPYGHPISSSLWTTKGWDELWKLPEMDFVQSHFYANSPKDMAEEVINICAQKRRDYPDKLHLFAEYGIMSGEGTLQNDPSGIHLHNGNWAGLMSGSASVPASWWHEEYIDPQGLYRVYRGIANFVADEKDMAKNAWRPLEIAYEEPKPIAPDEQLTAHLRVVGMQTTNKALIWAQNKNHTWFNVRDKAPIPPSAPARLVLNGFADGEYNIELWNTVEGTVIEQRTCTTVNSKLTVDLPEIEHDIALKIKSM